MTCVMACVNKTLRDVPDDGSADDCQNLEKILSAVVKRRKSIPVKCMEINKHISAYEVSKLDCAKIVFDENEEKENFKKSIQGFRRLRSFQFTLQDLQEAEQKLQKYFEQAQDINDYLGKKKTHFK